MQAICPWTKNGSDKVKRIAQKFLGRFLCSAAVPIALIPAYGPSWSRTMTITGEILIDPKGFGEALITHLEDDGIIEISPESFEALYKAQNPPEPGEKKTK